MLKRIEWQIDLTADREWLGDVIEFANREFSAGEGVRQATREWQRRLRAYLQTLASKNSAARRKLYRQAVAEMGAVRLRGTMQADGSKLQTNLEVCFRDLSQWYGAELCALFHEELDDRVRCCPECKDYFIDWPRRGGTPKVYCSMLHQDRARKRRERS